MPSKLPNPLFEMSNRSCLVDVPVVGVFVLGMLFAGPAWSQEAEAEQQEGSASSEASDSGPSMDDLPDDEKKHLLELIKSARASFSKGNFGEVVPKMKEAYEIHPDPEFLFRIALSHERNDEPKRAVEYYERYLEEKPNSEKRGRVEKAIESLEERLEKMRADREEEEPEGEQEEQEPEPEPEAAPAPEGTAESDEASGGNGLPIAMLATGGVFTASAVTFGVFNLQQRETVRQIGENRQSKSRSGVNFDSEVRKQNVYAGLTYASAALAAGALTWGLVGLSSGSESDRSSSASSDEKRGLRVRVGAAGAGIFLTGAF